MNNRHLSLILSALAICHFGAGRLAADPADDVQQQCANTQTGGGGGGGGSGGCPGDGDTNSDSDNSDSDDCEKKKKKQDDQNSDINKNPDANNDGQGGNDGGDSEGSTGQCVSDTSSGGSKIDLFTLNLRHFAYDYKSPSSAGSLASTCASCNGGGKMDAPRQDFSQIGIKRTLSLRQTTAVSSFGPGHFSEHDVTLNLFEVNGLTYVDCTNPAWKDTRRYSPSGKIFKDAVYNSVKSVTLFDANGAQTVSRTAATKAVYVAKNGSQMHFDLFAIDGNTTGGRLVKSMTADGVVTKRYEYATEVGDVAAPVDAKWRKSKIKDANGGEMQLSHTTLPNGITVLSKVAVSNGPTIAYDYDAGGNLAKVTHPNGDTSTFSRRVEGNLMKMSVADAGTVGDHRNKEVSYSNNIAASLLTLTADRPQVYNQSSMLARKVTKAGEDTFWAAVGGNGTGSPIHRKVYEGGDRLRFIDTAESSRYTKWSVPNGWKEGNAFGSISATKEAYGHSSPYQYYAANRSGRPPKITSPNGTVSNYLYDGAGFMTQESVGGKIRRRVNEPMTGRPILDVDFSGKTTLMTYSEGGRPLSRKTGWVYDKSLGGGAQIQGLVCAYYPGVTDLSTLDSLTPDKLVAADSVALGQFDVSAVSNYSLRFSGSLVLQTDGQRTFYLNADNMCILTIDGQPVLTVAYNQGTKSAVVDLTAGVHEIRVDFMQSAGPQGLNLTWSGPETTTGGTTVRTTIGSDFLTHVTQPNEMVMRATAAASEEKWEYFPAGDPLAGLVKRHLDGAGKASVYTYDTNRRLTKIEETGDDGALVTVQTRTYDALGNLLTSSDAMGRTITNSYDSRNRLIKTAYADGSTETKQFGADRDANLVIQTKDRAGSVTTIAYDDAGRPVTITRGYALADNEGNVLQVLPNPSVETLTYMKGTSEPVRRVLDGKVTEYEYDYKKNRVVATRTFATSTQTLGTKTVYSTREQVFVETDVDGHRTFSAYRNTDRELVRTVSELKPGACGSLANEDAVLALTRDLSTNPGYAITDYVKDENGRITGITDPRGIRTTIAYDAKGNEISRTEAVGLPEQRTITRTYDGANHLLSLTDGLNRTTNWAYFPSGRPSMVTLPDAKRLEFTYFDDGKLATYKDADGFTSKQFWSPCCGRDAGSANALGEGTLKFYDGEGRVTYTVQVKNVEAAKVALNFAGGITVPSDAVVGATTAKYDARGRLAATTKWLVAPASVDPKNPPVATDAAQGLTTTYAYFDDLADARFAPVLAELAKQSVVLTSGSAVIETSPAGDQRFTIRNGANETVASGVFNK